MSSVPSLISAALACLLMASVRAQGADTSDGDSRSQAEDRVGWRRHGPRDAVVRFRILGLNDFHGQLGAGRKVADRPVGSAPVLASYLRAAEAAHPGARTFIAHAGDHVGASPPASGLLQDEPSIAFLNLLANRDCRYDRKLHPDCNLVGTLGNHEFDDGVSELRRLLGGGNHANGPFLEKPYRGARFPYVCANVVDAKRGKPVFPPSVVKKVLGIDVAFIGAVLQQTPTIVTPTGVAGVTFRDEADAINAEVRKLKKKRVQAFIVLIHQGTSTDSFTGATPAEPKALPGAIGGIVSRLDPAVDVVVSGHSHGFTNALVARENGDPVLVTQAFSAGTAYAEIDLALDPRTRDIVEKSAVVRTTWADEGPGLTPDPAVADLIAAADAQVAPLVDRVIGTAAALLSRTPNPAGESALGNLVADSMRTAMASDFAFMNPGGIRANLPAGEVTWGDLFTILPFGNELVRMTLTGAQITRLLEQQWVDQPHPRPLQIAGLRYVWDEARPVGARIVDVRDGQGKPLDPTRSYSVAVNGYMAAGGDSLTVLLEGTGRVVGPPDIEALVEYVKARPQPFTAATEGRVEQRD